MLKIEDINVYYGNIQALKGISLSINEGEIVTLDRGKRSGEKHDAENHFRTVKTKTGENHV